MNPVKVERVAVWPGNVWLVQGPDGLLLVDAGSPWSARAILRRLNETRPAPLRMIFLTHAHIDHYGAASIVRKYTGAPIAIHRADADSLCGGETHLGMVSDWEWSKGAVPLVERVLRVRETPPDVVFGDGQTFQVAGLEATVLHTPGHTPGSSTLLVHDRAHQKLLAFVGDLILTTGAAHNQRSFAAEWESVAKSLKKLQNLSPDIVFPGHGSRPVTREELATLEVTGPAAQAAVES